MAYNFKKYNLFTNYEFVPPYDMSDGDVYKSLEDLYKEDGADFEHTAWGFYINKKTKFASKVTREKQAAVALTQDAPVNLPDHMLGEILEIMEDEEATEAINAGQCVFKVRKYYSKQYKKDCYSIEFI